MQRGDQHVCFVPKADIPPFIHQLLGSREQRRWNGEAERQFGVVVFDRVGGDGSTMSALLKRSTVRELDLQSLGSEARQKWAGINDLLRHPSARFGNVTLD